MALVEWLVALVEWLVVAVVLLVVVVTYACGVSPFKYTDAAGAVLPTEELCLSEWQVTGGASAWVLATQACSRPTPFGTSQTSQARTQSSQHVAEGEFQELVV